MGIMVLDEVIKKRKSVRKFKEDKIPENVLNEIMNLSKKSPSAGGIRGYSMIVTERNFTSINAPQYIIICTDQESYKRRYGSRGTDLYSIQDATIVGAYIQLLLVDRGLSSVWIGTFSEWRVQNNLGINSRPIAILAVGYERQ